MTLKLGSLFDGAGGFPFAAQEYGIEPVWASEIEPFPIAVTRKRFPNMKHLGDVSKINGAEVEPVDILSFGSPCQDLSVAGKRAGLKHKGMGDDETTRSGLFMEVIRIAKEMRLATNGRYPNVLIWENVPGALSSGSPKGEDFRIVLEELIKIKDSNAVIPRPPKGKWNDAGEIVGDGYSLGWRILDAQYFGVPQRRRRIFLVLCLGSERAGEILFERACSARDYESIRKAWKGPTKSFAFSTNAYKPQTYGFCSKDSNSMKSSNPHSGIYEADTSRCLDANGGNPTCNQGGVAVVAIEGNGSRPSHRGDGYSEEPVSYTLNSVEHHGVCYGIDQQGGKGNANYTEDAAPTLLSDSHGTPHGVCYAVENHPADSRVDMDDSGKVQTLTGRMGTGGGNVPMVICFCKGTRPHSAEEGQEWKETDTANTLNVNDMGEARANELVVEAMGLDHVMLSGGTTYQGKGYYEDQSGCLKTQPHGVFICKGVDGYNSALTGGVSSTLGVNAGMSTGRQAVLCCLNDEGGEVMGVTYDETHTLRATSNHPPIVLAARERCGCEGGGKGLLISEDVSHPIVTHNDQFIAGGCYALSKASRFTDTADEQSPALVATDYKEPPVVGYAEVLNYNKDDVQSKAVLDPAGIAPAIYAGEKRYGGGEMYILLMTEDERNPTIIALDRAAYNQGKNAQFELGVSEDGAMDEVNGTLQSHPSGGSSLNLNNVALIVVSDEVADIIKDNSGRCFELIPIEIILRRLTPTECGRLQGMPDWYCDGLEIPNPTEEDMVFWREVFETWRLATDPKKKPKSDSQIKKFLANPVSDSAMYKMWGNGMALPCVLYVMEGVKKLLEEEVDAQTT